MASFSLGSTDWKITAPSSAPIPCAPPPPRDSCPHVFPAGARDLAGIDPLGGILYRQVFGSVRCYSCLLKESEEDSLGGQPSVQWKRADLSTEP